MDGLATRLVEWAGVARPGEGDTGCLAAFSVTTVPHGVLVALAQGAGDGDEAAIAARAAIAVAAANAMAPLPLIIHRCEHELANGPGAALSLAVFDARRPLLWWLGVGHLPGYLMPARRGSAYRTLPLQPGLAGRHVSTPPATTRPLVLHDVLIIVTDNVKWDPGRAPGRMDSPRDIAARLVDDYAATGEDAAAVVVRYLGPR